jgi:hypothetical protein
MERTPEREPDRVVGAYPEPTAERSSRILDRRRPVETGSGLDVGGDRGGLRSM